MTNGFLPNLTLYTTEVLLVTPLEITKHPQHTTVSEGADVVFTVEARSLNGGAISYQWLRSSNDGWTWDIIEGATDSSYTIPAVTLGNDEEYYRCKITHSKSGHGSVVDYSNHAILRVVASPRITSHPQDITVTVDTPVTFAITAEAADAGKGGVLSYQWQVLADDGNDWEDIPGATEPGYTTPAVTIEDNGYQYRCKVVNTKNGVSSEPVYSNAATLSVEEHRIIFIKPVANDEVNINSGSLVLATISGDINTVASVKIKVDDGQEEDVNLSGNTIYYLLPANLSTGTHTITITMTNTAGHEIAESVTFYWESYPRDFGFGRFDFGEAPAEE